MRTLYMMKFKKIGAHNFTLLALAITACGGNGSGPNSAGEGEKVHDDVGEATKVVCHDSENTELCLKESCGWDPFNTVNDAGEVCAAHFNSINNVDTYKWNDFPSAEFDGLCSESDDENDTGPLPCLCTYGNFPPDAEICTPMGGGNEESGGTPTTGEPEIDTDGPLVETWVCSPISDANCQQRTGSGLGASDPACWQPTTIPPSSECVTASDYAGAVAACQCLCEHTDDILTDGCNNSSCQVTTHLDCTLTNPGETPVPVLAHSGEYGCTTQVDEAVACPSTIKIFDASISVILADGTSAANSGIVGYLDYSISACANGSCAFDMPLLMLPHRDMSGYYVQVTSTSVTTGTYSLDDLHLQMNGSLSGVYNQSSNSITLPTGSFTASGNVTSASLNSVPLPLMLPGERLELSTSQVVGSLSSTSHLTLNFTFAVPGGTAAVSLTTR